MISRRTFNRLRTAQDELFELRDVIRTQAAKWLKVDEDRLHVPMPLVFTAGDNGVGSAVQVNQNLGGDRFGEDTAVHNMPVEHLFASDEELDQDYQRYLQLKERFQHSEGA